MSPTAGPGNARAWKTRGFPACPSSQYTPCRMGMPASREGPDAARRGERSGSRSGSCSARRWAVRSCSSVECRAYPIKIPPEGMVICGAYGWPPTGETVTGRVY